MVYELDVDGVPAYLQLVEVSDEYGELVRVVPGRPGDDRPLQERLAEPEQFSAFFLATVAERRNIVQALGTADVPPRVSPSPLKAPGGITPDGTVLNWWIIAEGREWRVDRLTSEQADYTVAEIVNAEVLRERVRSGWRHADVFPVPPPPSSSLPTEEQGTTQPRRTHFIYFDNPSDAAAAAAALARFGTVTTEQSASDLRQLLLKVDQANEGDDEAIIDTAGRFRGDYDGTETSV
jgi:hypothetical protein